jgi:hypothetical protein
VVAGIARLVLEEEGAQGIRPEGGGAVSGSWSASSFSTLAIRRPVLPQHVDLYRVPDGAGIEGHTTCRVGREVFIVDVEVGHGGAELLRGVCCAEIGVRMFRL